MSEHRDTLAKLLSLSVHELRTPVSVVSGYLRMLLRHFGDNLTEQQKKLLQESEKSCGTLASLLAELSELAQIEDGRLALKREPIPIFGLLEQVAESVHEAEDRGVTLQVRGAGMGAVVMGDRDRLATAFATLLAATLRERAEAGVVLGLSCIVAGDGLRRSGRPTRATALHHEMTDRGLSGLFYHTLVLRSTVTFRTCAPTRGRGRS